MAVQLDNIFNDSDFEDNLNCFPDGKKKIISKTTDIYKEEIEELMLQPHINSINKLKT